MPYEVAYAARVQVDQLTSAEKNELGQLFESAAPQAISLQPQRQGGLFVSQLGGDKRVLWQRLASGIPEILSVVDKSYAAA